VGQKWRILAALGRFVLVLACIGTAYQEAGTIGDTRAYPPPGRLVDVGGYRLHLYCMGRGSPTVVLDGGIGETSLVWRGVQAAVAIHTRVCSYDRAGLGWSDPGPRPRTSGREIRELHRLLVNAGETGPYVLAGHSFGGWNALLYAHQYRRDIVGLVLVDAAPLDEEWRFPAAERAQEAAQRADAQGCLAGETPLAEAARIVGLTRLEEGLHPAPAPPLLDDYPPAVRAQVRFVTSRWLENGAPLCGAGAAEIVALGESAAEGNARATLGTIPLVVVTRGLPETWAPPIPVRQTEQAWRVMQRELVALSATGRQIIARRSRHHIQLNQPGLVVDAIAQVVADVRHGGQRRLTAQGPFHGASSNSRVHFHPGNQAELAPLHGRGCWRIGHDTGRASYEPGGGRE